MVGASPHAVNRDSVMGIEKRTQRSAIGPASDINMLIYPLMLIAISRFASNC
jgi:hypothetical protein